ncbi:hypothetical protein FisN_33Hu062 [Fistulifera solaris]|jgi:hypothetical protein|uniref:Uncharacterized protein n=1 Tax=Fistulifera solaris TaxID=1519565 RepID=A0A1Z5KQR8_FISSO|nr:hypothetical protein FisN_33Hu062 [Fistulifera solaris]|eukprot:GAX28664.1 hypothetical protein FisN_33Hu062 [Fistulifera solaris]
MAVDDTDDFRFECYYSCKKDRPFFLIAASKPLSMSDQNVDRRRIEETSDKKSGTEDQRQTMEIRLPSFSVDTDIPSDEFQNADEIMYSHETDDYDPSEVASPGAKNDLLRVSTSQEEDYEDAQQHLPSHDSNSQTTLQIVNHQTSMSDRQLRRSQRVWLISFALLLLIAFLIAIITLLKPEDE